MDKTFNFVYMLKCDNGSIYTGYTNNIVNRYTKHLLGTSGAKFLNTCDKFELVACWMVDGEKGNAMSVEYTIKSFTPQIKKELIIKPQLLKKYYKSKNSRDVNISVKGIKRIKNFCEKKIF